MSKYFVVTGRCNLVGKHEVINGFFKRSEARDEIDCLKHDRGYSKLAIHTMPDSDDFTMAAVHALQAQLNAA